MRHTRRRFLEALAAVPWAAGGAGLVEAIRGQRPGLAAGRRFSRRELGFPDPGFQWRGQSSVSAAGWRGQRRPFFEPKEPPPQPYDWATAGAALRQRFHDLRRHLVFEYYPWYGANPWEHWNDSGRRPPYDIASNYMPLLGPYDSNDPAVVERHARWIVESGVGAINLSWWGPESDTNRAVPLIMDVMRAHDVRVTFHLEPYTDNRSATYARDILYLLKEYGDKRRWDCLLLLEDAQGRSGPVFKSFRTILTSTFVDCHGLAHKVPDYTPDGEWRRATDTLRSTLRHDFDHVTLLADSLDFYRTRESGFDGLAVYDNYVEPVTWRRFASEASAHGVVFSFNVNPGFDGVALREVEPDSCYTPSAFLPGNGAMTWPSARSRLRAVRLGTQRIRDSLQATVTLQSDASMVNVRKGFFLVYVNSFNEWHEGHQFEPMKNFADLRPEELAAGYHNAAAGGYRLAVLRGFLEQLLGR